MDQELYKQIDIYNYDRSTTRQYLNCGREWTSAKTWCKAYASVNLAHHPWAYSIKNICSAEYLLKPGNLLSISGLSFNQFW
jgi:hypothetical protein